MITVIGNLKGGTGKSTVTFNIAVWLATAGREVHLFDLDPQRTLTDVVEVRDEEGFEPVLSVHHDLAELAALKKKRSRPETLVDVGVSDMDSVRAALALADRILVFFRGRNVAEEALQALPGIQWLDVRLYQRTAYRRSFSEGLAVFEMGPSSKSAREVMKLARRLYPK